MGFQTIDITGQRFNFFTVIKQVERPSHLKNNHTYWLCRCDCGNEKVVDQRALKSGNTKSCGCYSKFTSKQNLMNYVLNKEKTKNRYEICGDVVKMYTKKGTEFIIDKSDFENVYKHYWIERAGYIGSKLAENMTPRYIMLHRFLIGEIPKGLQVDHINRNKHDNTRKNLRIVTPLENCQNKDKTPKSKCGYRNIHFRERIKKYEASITYNNKKYWVGSFDNPQEAEEAIIKKRKEVKGD